jgi:hypothetical protein
MKKLLILVAVLIMANVLWGQIFSTNFSNEANWDNPGGVWTSYNEKTYSEDGWFFRSTNAVRGAADESYGGSAFSFRDRDIFSVKNTIAISNMGGFSFQLRDWMLGDGEQRDVRISFDSGQNWETVATINKIWFAAYQVYQQFDHFSIRNTISHRNNFFWKLLTEEILIMDASISDNLLQWEKYPVIG